MSEVIKIMVETAHNGYMVRFKGYAFGIDEDEESELDVMVFEDKDDFRKWVGNRVDEWTDGFELRVRGEKP